MASMPKHDHGMNHSHSPSLAVGPKMDDVVAKYKADPKALLTEILEPSRNIEEKYRKFMFELKDDDVVVSGNIASEDAESVTIQTGATAAQSQKIPKSNIESRRPSTVSIMPAGLLNTSDKEQIHDLIAYLVANGKADAPAFKTKEL